MSLFGWDDFLLTQLGQLLVCVGFWLVGFSLVGFWLVGFWLVGLWFVFAFALLCFK